MGVVCGAIAGLAALIGLGEGNSWWRAGFVDAGGPIGWLLAYAAVSAVHEVVGFGQRGRTVGKLLLKLRVADLQTESPMTWRASVIRWAVKNLTTQVPVAGGVFSLVDAAFVFRADKRTVHDHAARTVVLRA